MKNIIVIDNFYENPYAVRNFALTKARYLSNEKLPKNFPGTESEQSFFSDEVVRKIEKAIGEEVLVNPAECSFGVFAKTFSNDERNRTIHVDSSDWSAVLFLSKPADCRGGTVFYEDLETGWTEIPELTSLKKMGFPSVEHFKSEYLKKKSQQFNNWKISSRVAMKFNRMVLFRSGKLFHAAEGYFGETDDNCRLLQLFFLKTKKGN